jgi:DNA-directed RNA polymerase specialized sigma subunit
MLGIVDELVVRYKSTRDEDVFNQIYKQVKPRLEAISNSIFGSTEDKEDLFSWCCVALLRSIEFYDAVEAAAKNSNFMNYLSVGAWHEKVAIAGRNPNCSEPMFDKNRVNYTIRENGIEGGKRDTTKLSLDVIADEENGSESVTFADLLVDRKEMSHLKRCTITEFIERILGYATDEIERMIIELLIIKGYNLTEIAQDLGFSIAKVSLILKAFRERVQADIPDDLLQDFSRVCSNRGWK